MGKLRELFGLVVSLGVFLGALYWLFYADGGYVLGAEGAYYLDAILLAKNYGYLWYNSAVGYIATSYNFVFHLILIQWLFGSVRLVNFVTIASLYVLPFAAVYFLCLELKLKPYLALLFSVFYLTNPFTSYFLLSINQWNMIASYLLPAFFLIIYKFYHRPILLFTIFGLHSLLFAFGNANPPTMVIYQLALIIFVVIISLLKVKHFSVRDIAFHYLLVFTSFILFNFWWIVNWFFAAADAGASYSSTYALGWLRNISNQIPALWRTFSLSGLLPFPWFPQQDFFTAYYGNTLSEVIFLFPIILVALSLLRKDLMSLHLKLLGIILVIVGLLAKGINPPFGIVYEFAIVYVPLFKIFKTAPEKWGLLFVFLLTLYLILVLERSTKTIFSKIVLLGLFLYSLLTIVPFVTGNFLPDYKYNGTFHVSKHFFYKQEYLDLKTTLNDDPLQYRVLSLPGHLNYQVALSLGNKKYYGGGDPVMTNTNKPFIATYNNLFAPSFLALFHNVSDPNYSKMLGLYNIKKIVINKDLYPWFGFAGKENVDQMEKIFDQHFTSAKNEVIDLYDTGDSFTPRIYIAKQIIKTDLTRDDLPEILSRNKVSDRPAIFLSDKNLPAPFVPEVKLNETNLPKLTFKKINPTKYKLWIEGAKAPFLLVFSESFHRGWKLYPGNENTLKGTNIVGNYFNGEIKEIEPSLAFFDRKPWETWSIPAIAPERHGLVNGYANSWLIRPEDVGGKENFELILDYWPQRIFYIGTPVSLLTVIVSLILTTRSLLKKKNQT
ncbi:MAG: hypothetical protein AAB973_02940 [Patescibacteria group bacterium]